MMKLEDFRPTEREDELTADMPEQVAIGYIRSRRRDHMSKAKAKHHYGKDAFK